MEANRSRSKTLQLEPVEVSSSAELARQPADGSRTDAKEQRDLRMTTSDEFLATAAREYEAGTVDRGLWRRAVDQCRGDPSLVIAAYLRARAMELQSWHKSDDRSFEARGARATPLTTQNDTDARPPAQIASTFFPGVPSSGIKRKLVLSGAATAALACMVVALYVMVSPPGRESVQSRTAAVAAPPSNRSAPAAAPEGARPMVTSSASEANAGRVKPALATTVQQLKEAGNWNVLVLYAAEWTRQEPGNSAAWRELSGGYARLHQYNDALDAAAKAAQLSPADAVAWRNLGQINLAVDRFPEAANAFDKALALSPDDAGALCGVAAVAQRQSAPKGGDLTAGRAAAPDPLCLGLAAREITVAPVAAPSVRKVVSSAGR